MRAADTRSNLKYYDVNHFLDISNEIEIGSKEWFQAIKKAGYKFCYRWINSDDGWMYFATNSARANEGAAELFKQEKPNYSIKEARGYFSDQIDVYSIDEVIEDWF